MESGKKKSKLKIIIPIVIAIVVIAVVIAIIPKGNSKELQIGETATSKKIELTLTDIQYGDMICDIVSVGNTIYDSYLLPTNKKSDVFHPDKYIKNDDFTFVSLSFNFKYLGTKEIPASSAIGKISIQYDNKYNFEENLQEIAGIVNNEWKWITAPSYKIKPLSQTYTCRAIITIPKSVAEDTKPLTVNFGNFKYKIR